MVLDKLRERLHNEPQVVTQLKAKQFASDGQRKALVDKFLALTEYEPEHVAWAAADPAPELRQAAMTLLKRYPDQKLVMASLTPLLRTRSEAQRRGVQRFMQELAGADFPRVVAELSEGGDDFVLVACLDVAKDLPPDVSYRVFRRSLMDGGPQLRARALKALAEGGFKGPPERVSGLALPLLSDENEELRLGALSVLEKNPSENLIPAVLQVARSGGGRIAEAAFATLKRLIALAKTDHTDDILPLLADANPVVRAGAASLLSMVPPQALVTRFLVQFNGAYVWVRDRALEAAGQYMPNFLPLLLQQITNPDPNVAAGAKEMALVINDARGVPAWMHLLRTETDWWIRHRSIEGLGRFGAGNDDVAREISGLLRDPDLFLTAAAALADLGDRRAAAPLFEAFKAANGRPDDQVEILDALAQLARKVPDLIPAVGAQLGKVAAHTAVDPLVREKAGRLVGRLQGAAAEAALPSVVAAPEPIDFTQLPNPRLVDYLRDTMARGGSDFHLATGFVPHRRIDGELQPIPGAIVTREMALGLCKEVLTAEEWDRLQKDRQIDSCLKIEGLGRFRANFFWQRAGLDAAFRLIPKHLPSLRELGLPESVWDVTRFTQGLVLVTGPAGCGKSTTLAALVDRCNEQRKGHIITVEDPVEFVHPNKESLVNQRQVPHHTASFARALKAALREDPDVIMIGEMRDLETISLAISASETGHLVFGTLHTTNAPGTIDRVINVFPPGQQGQIRTMIADSLKAVVSQALLPRRGGKGRVAAFEILRGTQNVAALIREGKTFQLPSALQTGQMSGMNTMDQALLKLVEEGKVDPEAALDRATKKEPFEKLVAEERQALA